MEWDGMEASATRQVISAHITTSVLPSPHVVKEDNNAFMINMQIQNTRFLFIHQTHVLPLS
jgi:hypothetical protein